jgi:hypothetical protein
MLTIPQSIQIELREVQRLQLSGEFPDENLRTYDAVALTYGLGPAVYLTLEGEMIIWDYASNKAAYRTNLLSDFGSYLTIGSRRLMMPALLALLPLAPSSSTQCQLCDGIRWKTLPNSTHEVVCWECYGLGWVDTVAHSVT